MSIKARVFVSCGQNDKELKIAEKIKKRLEDDDKGFEVYVARKDHVLSCLTKNIFDKLNTSEYFLFIDFKREKLIRLNKGRKNDKNKDIFRGSLFTNQELAIATFLQDIKVLGFQEKGVIAQDGIIKYTQINPIEFDDRSQLPELVIKEVEKNEWKNDWRNELQISFHEDYDKIDLVGGRRDPSHWYHLRVRNMNKRKTARNCIAYIEKINHIEKRLSYKPEQVELKWKYLVPQSISIAPDSERRLDAFHYSFSDSIIKLGINPFLVDNNLIPVQYQLRTQGTYEIDYVIFSDNFSAARARLQINKIDRNQRFKFKQIPLEND